MKEPLCSIYDRCVKDNCSGYNSNHVDCPLWKIKGNKYYDEEVLILFMKAFGKGEGERLFNLMMKGVDYD